MQDKNLRESPATADLCPTGITTAKSFLRMEPDSQPDDAELPGNTLELRAILVVDDDKQLASALQWILADQNFLVDVAFDGKEAMLKIKVNEYDLVICDLIMPGLLGDDFYLKAKPARPD